jgi:N-acetylneuraminic acid mutarotase
MPGARSGAVSWRDAAGSLWLFGGTGQDSHGNSGSLNDLWRWDGANWTWIAGDSSTDHQGIYGDKGVPSAFNKPGSRSGAVSWLDPAGNLLLFGGSGLDDHGNSGTLNDLWRWDGVNWTWVSGDTTNSRRGVYGAKGVPDPANKPGARSGAVSWIDGTGRLWLFGGTGQDDTGSSGILNDLWRWDGANWSWVSGDRTAGHDGIYGARGVPSDITRPGSRSGAVSWLGAAGNLMLFGGAGLDASGTSGSLNDIWQWDGTNWTWVDGDSHVNQAGVYGAKGTASGATRPGARSGAVSGFDISHRAVVFGGSGRDGSGNNGSLNDLWRFQ